MPTLPPLALLVTSSAFMVAHLAHVVAYLAHMVASFARIAAFVELLVASLAHMLTTALAAIAIRLRPPLKFKDLLCQKRYSDQWVWQ